MWSPYTARRWPPTAPGRRHERGAAGLEPEIVAARINKQGVSQQVGDDDRDFPLIIHVIVEILPAKVVLHHRAVTGLPDIGTKSIILVVLFLILLIGIISILSRGKGKIRGQLTIKNINKKYLETKQNLLEEILSKQQFKKFTKEQKKAEKNLEKLLHSISEIENWQRTADIWPQRLEWNTCKRKK